MTIEELEGLTGLPKDEIMNYLNNGLIGREENGETVFGCDDAKKIGLIRRLLQSGMREKEICEFFALTRKGDTQKAVAILQKLRQRLMNSVREEQKSIDVLDCIIYQTKNKSGGAL